jgi:phosphoribosylaminoimidazole (AIR) synthetase
MTPIETVDDALRTVIYLAGWGVPTQAELANAANPADELAADLLAGCYEDALKRTEGLVLSRARLLRAWDVLNAHGVLR